MDFDSRKIIPDLIEFLKIMLPLSRGFVSFCSYPITEFKLPMKKRLA